MKIYYDQLFQQSRQLSKIICILKYDKSNIVYILNILSRMKYDEIYINFIVHPKNIKFRTVHIYYLTTFLFCIKKYTIIL